ncbi:MAG: hypothetical protein ACPL4E_09940 [Thermoproteota archaeon]
MVYAEFTEFHVRTGVDSVSINPDATVFTRKLFASIEQRIMLEKRTLLPCPIRCIPLIYDRRYLWRFRHLANFQG